MSDVRLYIPANSAMWDYSPGDMMGGWIDDQSGRKVCQQGMRCAAEIVNAQCQSRLLGTAVDLYTGS